MTTYDLNISYPVNNYDTTITNTQLTNLKNIVITNYQNGIYNQAINFQIFDSIKLPMNKDLNPIPVGKIKESLIPQFPKLKLFTRITLIINDLSKLSNLSKLQQCFDLIAIQPLNEKVFQNAIVNLENNIDIISIDLSSRLNFYLKHKVVSNGLNKGIKFEIQYSQTISNYISNDVGSNSNLIKKNWFNNVLQLIRSSRSRGLIISSGAQNPLQIRNLNDILILLKTLGIKHEKGKSFITLNPERALINGKLRTKSYRQTVLQGDENIVDDIQYNVNERDVTKLTNRKRVQDSAIGQLIKKKRKIE
ncbi:unnamed protein product [Candida verbasci]|uniref:Uncharacterized protein n=1 Tax=Candida verbasci TaxID=1227364 RepID=A0A9W4X9R6_9ASCO|nr:unnamed protein product [Candida verbasci]